MATFQDFLFGTQAARAGTAPRLEQLFGPRISSDEVPITLAGDAIRELELQRGIVNDVSGLNPRDSRQLFDLAFQGDFADVANQFGLNRDDVLTAARNQVSPFTANQREAQDANLALGRGPLDPAFDASVATATDQQFNPFNNLQLGAADIFGGIGDDPLSNLEFTAAQQFGGAAGTDPFQGQAFTAANALSDTASGNMLGANPFLDATFNQAADRVTEQFNKNILPSIESRFARSGRYGSDAMQRQQLDAADVVGENITDLATNIYGGNFEAERGRQLAAADSLGQLFGQGSTRQLQAAGGIADIGAGGQNRALTAGSQLADLGAFGQDQRLQAATLAPALADTAFNAQVNRNNLIAGVGDQERQLLDQLLARSGAFFDTNINSDFQDIERVANINNALGLTGANGQGGTGGQIQQNRAATGIGGALGGAVLGAQIGSVVPGIGTGIGAALGGGLGLIGGLI